MQMQVCMEDCYDAYQSWPQNHYALYYLQIYQSIQANHRVVSIQLYKMGRFKDTYDLQKRRDIYQRQSKLHPNKLGIIIEIHPKSQLQVDRYFKFMANSSYSITSIQQLIRKELSRTNQTFKNNSIFLFCRNKIAQPSKKLMEYAQNKEQDNFIYFYMAETQTF